MFGTVFQEALRNSHYTPLEGFCRTGFSGGFSFEEVEAGNSPLPGRISGSDNAINRMRWKHAGIETKSLVTAHNGASMGSLLFKDIFNQLGGKVSFTSSLLRKRLFADPSSYGSECSNAVLDYVRKGSNMGSNPVIRSFCIAGVENWISPLGPFFKEFNSATQTKGNELSREKTFYRPTTEQHAQNTRSFSLVYSISARIL